MGVPVSLLPALCYLPTYLPHGVEGMNFSFRMYHLASTLPYALWCLEGTTNFLLPGYFMYVSYIAGSNNTTALRIVHNFLDIPIVALASRGFLRIADLSLVSPCAPRVYLCASLYMRGDRRMGYLDVSTCKF